MQCSSVFCQKQLELLLTWSPQGIYNWEAGDACAKISCKRHILCQKQVGNVFVSTAYYFIYTLTKVIFFDLIFVVCIEAFDLV